MITSELTQAIRNNPQALEAGKQRITEVLSRSATDPDFRQLLLSDSRTALTQHFGHEVTGKHNIVFVENKADATIVLPDPIDPNAELSESELEAVAGGIVDWIIIGACLYIIGDSFVW